MKAKICLSALSRRYCNVTVDVPDDFESWSEYKKNSFMSNLFIEKVDGGYDKDWQDDYDWGFEEGAHHVIEVLK